MASGDGSPEETAQVLELEDLSGIDEAIASELQEAGYTTIEHVAAASPDGLATVDGINRAIAQRVQKETEGIDVSDGVAEEVAEIGAEMDEQRASTVDDESDPSARFDELEAIPGINGERAEALRSAGIESVEDVSKVDDEKLAAVDGISAPLAASIHSLIGDASEPAQDGEEETAESSPAADANPPAENSPAESPAPELPTDVFFDESANRYLLLVVGIFGTIGVGFLLAAFFANLAADESTGLAFVSMAVAMPVFTAPIIAAGTGALVALGLRVSTDQAAIVSGLGAFIGFVLVVLISFLATSRIGGHSGETSLLVTLEGIGDLSPELLAFGIGVAVTAMLMTGIVNWTIKSG